MYTIGEFAALGRVSVRMLRHYDAIGLLRPASVDASSGYRHYEVTQLRTLLRIVELRDLGCSLDDAADVLAAPEVPTALRDALERRRTQLRISLADDTAQLARLERRLSQLEGATTMSEIIYRRIEPATVYTSSGIVPSGEEPATVIGRILPALQRALDTAGVDYQEPGVFWYESVDGTDDLRVHVSWRAGTDPRPGDGYELVELEAVEHAAVTVYRGDMAGIGQAWNSFAQAVVDDGGEPFGSCREIYLESEPLPQSDWVTELVQPLR